MACLRKFIFLSIFLAATSCCVSGSEDLIFPEGFMFGAATAAYQIEGGWNSSDKSPSIWDAFVHDNPSVVVDGSTGDVACDSYHFWKQDVQLAKDLGLHFYRFSISWSRLLPSGFQNHISQDGANYYRNLISELLDNGIQPMVTLNHWDMPNRLHKLGGWTNPLMADWFADYARVAFSLFGDKVKYWNTLNEPISVCSLGYGITLHAPGLGDPEIGYYLCVKHSLLAHAKAYRIYDEEFRQRFNGKVAIANHHMWYEPKNAEEQELAELVQQYGNGLYSHPIYSEKGGWPTAIEDYFIEKSRDEGYSSSRLPPFTNEEVKLIQGTQDYYAFNHYTSRQVRKAEPGEAGPWFLEGAPDLNLILGTKADWPDTSCDWFKVNPEGLRNQLNWVKKNYGDVEIIITENGYATDSLGPGLNDTSRVNYYKDYLAQVLKAIKEDGVNVVGYTAWTLIDNFEWSDGYTKQFGLHAVDFNDPERPRVARDSARFYAKLIKDNFNAYKPKTTD